MIEMVDPRFRQKGEKGVGMIGIRISDHKFDSPTIKLSIISTLPLEYPQIKTFVAAGASKLTISNGNTTFSI